MKSNIVKLGSAPDYIMRKAGAILSHSTSVKIFKKNNSRCESRLISNRSFKSMARELQIIAESRIGDAKVFGDLSLAYAGKFEITGADLTILLNYQLDPKLTLVDRNLLLFEFNQLLRTIC